jgi:hypothetical protein
MVIAQFHASRTLIGNLELQGSGGPRKMPDPRRIKQDSPHIASIPLAVGLLDPWPIGANHVHDEEGKRNQKDRPPSAN